MASVANGEHWYGTEESRKSKTMADFLRYLWQQDCKPGSDLVINLSSPGASKTRYEVHKLVMTCHSSYIAQMVEVPDSSDSSFSSFKMPLAESFWQEQQPNGFEIILGQYMGMSEDTLKSIIRFAYTLETDQITSENAPSVWAGAEVMGMPHLQKVCLGKNSNCREAGQILLDKAVPPENKVFVAPIPPPPPKEPTPPPPKVATPPPPKVETPPPAAPAITKAPTPPPPPQGTGSPGPPPASSPAPSSLTGDSSAASTASTTPLPTSPEPSVTSAGSEGKVTPPAEPPAAEAKPAAEPASPAKGAKGKKGGAPKEAKSGTPAKDGSTPAPKGKGKKEEKAGETGKKEGGKGKKKK